MPQGVSGLARTEHEAIKSRRAWLALMIVALSMLAFATHTRNLGTRAIQHDEVLTLSHLQAGVPALFAGHDATPRLPGADPYPPLYFIGLAAFARLAGTSDFALRFVSAAWAVLLVPLLYAAGAHFWDRRAGLMAAALGALSPAYLAHAQEARMHAMAAALGLFSVYALGRALEGRRRAWLAAALASAVAVVLTDYRALALLPVLAVQALLYARLPRLWHLALAIALAGVLLAGFSAGALALWHLPTGAAWPRLSAALASVRDELHALAAGPHLPLSACWPAEIVWLALLLAGALLPAARRRRPFLLAYLSIPLLPAMGTLLASPGPAESHLLLVSPALYLAVARGLACCSRRLMPVALAAGLVLAGSLGLGTQRQVWALASEAGQPYREMAQAIRLDERPGDVIVVSGQESAVALLHYYRGRLGAVALRPPSHLSEAERVLAIQAAADLAARFERIWLVRADLSVPRGEVEEWLRESAFLAESRAYRVGAAEGLLELYLTESPRLATLPPCQHSAQVSFGGLRLEGYDLPLRPVTGGQPAWVTLYWRALSPERVGVSLRLVDQQGREWARSDQIPYPALPPERWPKDATMRHEPGVVVPLALAPGWYNLELRLYDPVSGRPIEPSDGAAPGPLHLGPLLVEATWGRPAQVEGLSRVSHSLGGRGVAFGEDVALRAFHIVPPEVMPGEWLHVNLYWQVRSRPESDLALELDLVDGRGEAVSSQTVSPVAPWHPSAAWRAEELLWAQHEVLVPPTARPGLYRLELRMRDGAGRPLPIRDRWRFWTWGVDVATLGEVRVVQAPQRSEGPSPEHRLDAQNTARVDLLGYEGVPEGIEPGEAFEVILYWRAAAVPKRSYKVSVQVLDAQRSILAQEDSVPAAWSRPTTRWRAGEVVNDPHRLTIPSSTTAGTATLIVALYDEDTGRRVEWFEGSRLREHVVLCQVDVRG
ncbi:MAG: glycosyltransferase family 39 protein [Anaerolineae bacterium]|nr:glycosyltransferase family 39 protein [Anaerolineae bacterium]